MRQGGYVTVLERQHFVKGEGTTVGRTEVFAQQWMIVQVAKDDAPRKG
jgi:hypothetical protein